MTWGARVCCGLLAPLRYAIGLGFPKRRLLFGESHRRCGVFWDEGFRVRRTRAERPHARAARTSYAFLHSRIALSDHELLFA